MFGRIEQKFKRVLNDHIQSICRSEFESQKFVEFNERPVEYGFVLRKLAETYPMTVLDIGTGTTALPQLIKQCGCLVTAIDNVRDYWTSEMVNRHYHVLDDDITDTRLTQRFDLITCVSVLEHIPDAATAIRNMFTLLKPNGHLLLTFPYSDSAYVGNVYELPGSAYGQDAPYITQSFSRSELDSWVNEHRARIVDQEYWEFWDGEYWTVGKQLLPPRRVEQGETHQLSCVHIQASPAQA